MRILVFIGILCIPFLHSAQEDDGIKRYYFKDSIVAIEKWYSDDNKLDSLKTYYNTGELFESFHYNKGHFNGLSFKYNISGEKLTTWNFLRGELIERIDHKIEFNKKNEEKVKKHHAELKVINEKLKENPRSLKNIFIRANIRVNLGDYTLALNDLKYLEKQFFKVYHEKDIPEKVLASVYDNLATIYSVFEMENHCIHYKLKSIKTSPKESRLYYNLGNYLVWTKNYRLGIEYYNKAINMLPNHSFANWGLAIAYTDLGNYEKAMNHITIALKQEANIYEHSIGSTYRDLWTTRGFLYHKLGETNKGIADLEEALSINKDNPYTHRNLGIIYFETGDYNKACEHLQKSKDLGFEKIYDSNELEPYIEVACKKTELIESKTVLAMESILATELSDKPYVYPNPSVDIINFKNLSLTNYNYFIFDYAGKLISEGVSNDTNTISISNLISGVYILKIRENDIVETFRFIKE
ncbi:T9SS type A sorting domain-containing protein [Mariniflexile sp.]|uniref:T9SS type A sorting domain-containing protein n=1 Tax=Mariniflexile sp. TaxID=1979402 RepID=UPI0035693B2D